MSTELTAFVIPVRIDHPDRLKNAQVTLRYILECTTSSIVLIENGPKSYKDVLWTDNPRFTYVFQETKDPIFHRTKILNEGLQMAKTECAVIYDTDVMVPVAHLKLAEDMIVSRKQDIVHPFTSKNEQVHSVYYVPQAVRDAIPSQIDFMHLERLNALSTSYIAGPGFLIFVHRTSYLGMGGENEHFISWGAEDIERMYRTRTLGVKYAQIAGAVYHLEHYRDVNGGANNPFLPHNNAYLEYLQSRSPADLLQISTGSPNPDAKIVTMLNLGTNGRLGNQLFQIAFCLSLAKMTGRHLVLPDSFARYNEVLNHQPFKLDSVQNLQSLSGGMSTHSEPQFRYSSLPWKKLAQQQDTHWNCNGYFQSWKHFYSIRDDIKRVFRLNAEREAMLRSKYCAVLGVTTVGLHVRRTDFLVESNPQLPMDLAYYTRALRLLKTRIEESQVVVSPTGAGPIASIRVIIASDDLAWCRSHIAPVITSELGPKTEIVYAENEMDIDDLFTLSYCDHLILSTSTFALWAAFLQQPENKPAMESIIICPQHFFKPSSDLNATDMVPSTWIRLQ